MIVAGVQTGQIRGGSARIRYYTFMKHLKCDKTDDLEKADVVYFQKKSSKDIIKLARELKSKGKKIVYDCDDGDGDRDRKDRNDPAMFKIADAITTDTDARAKQFRKKTNTPVYVVQDCIDYDIDPTDHIEIKPTIETIGTFGTHKVLEATFNMIKHIPRCKNQYYITDRNIKKYDKHGWRLIHWGLITFVDNLKLFDLCILLHPKDKVGNLKSNNRLLVCMALGIPTIVSDTAAYSKTMCLVNIYGWDIKIKKAIDLISDYETRKYYSIRMSQFAWGRYSPAESARQLEQVFRRLYDSSL